MHQVCVSSNLWNRCNNRKLPVPESVAELSTHLQLYWAGAPELISLPESLVTLNLQSSKIGLCFSRYGSLGSPAQPIHSSLHLSPSRSLVKSITTSSPIGSHHNFHEGSFLLIRLLFAVGFSFPVWPVYHAPVTLTCMSSPHHRITVYLVRSGKTQYW